MNGRDRSMPVSPWWIAALATAAAAALAATQLPPPVIHFCSANCFTLVLRDGQYVREDGTSETWTIERFLADDVVLHRHDLPTSWNGGKTDVVYSGRADNDRLADLRVEGQLTPSMSMAWGGALSTVPGSNAERDGAQPQMSNNARLMHVPLPSSALPRTSAGGAVVNPPVSAAPAGTPLAVSPSAAEPGKETTRIYVLTEGPGMNTTELLTYTLDGERVAPHLVLAREKSAAMAVDARGELYVSHNAPMDFTVVAYRPDGTPDPGFPHFPAIVKGLAVSPAGNLYVLSQTEAMHQMPSLGVVQVFTRDGHPIGAPIMTQLEDPTCVAVAADGTIYVASGISNAIVSFTATGQRTSLVITDGLSRPQSMAVDGAGKLYVLNGGPQRLTTYTPDGKRTTPNITALDVGSRGLAVDGAGRIYVSYARQLGLYSPEGAQTKLFGDVPVSVHSIAVH